jgi:hypothetical protein
VLTHVLSHHLNSLTDLGVIERTQTQKGRRGSPMRPYVLVLAERYATTRPSSAS